eukprot:CAMPEP_0177456112 /NCGR_PEP_ID=MMETSP0369-20130122/12265_1 /TAXON_ID=447022 ORGANISM="Scrippsiella hangoei-like, Strain SHHI-4" /NCGR_SAMPLE_ID=MMETSP0369 /ASSEMBLY_ACC=CAM_ASM_000364 /LENGTH=60 /DNA_ID=CAMNT_0018929025 /DNA_START=360 /DNA_END=538 /DNA_ORIENTATION=-
MKAYAAVFSHTVHTKRRKTELQSLFPTRQEKQHGFHALQLRHVLSGAAALSCSMARCSAL